MALLYSANVNIIQIRSNKYFNKSEKTSLSGDFQGEQHELA